MIDFLTSLDQSVFTFFNRALQNPVFDVVMPFLTDLNKNHTVLITFIIVYVALLAKGNWNTRIALLLLIPAITFSDQLNSSVIKFLVERPRPCHSSLNVHLLVPCGSGYSFPSSHAVNTFAGAAVLSYFFVRAAWAFLSFAGIIAFSRVYVGVHYPSDVLGGAVIGLLCGALMISLYELAESWWVHRSHRSKES